MIISTFSSFIKIFLIIVLVFKNELCSYCLIFFEEIFIVLCACWILLVKFLGLKSVMVGSLGKIIFILVYQCNSLHITPITGSSPDQSEDGRRILIGSDLALLCTRFQENWERRTKNFVSAVSMRLNVLEYGSRKISIRTTFKRLWI